MDPDTRDANGYRYDRGSVARRVGYQPVTNESWPFRDEDGWHARGLNDKPAEEQVDVVARVVFQDDGETWLEGRAVRWTDNHTHACVLISDPRLQTGYVWLRAHEVRPRS